MATTVNHTDGFWVSPANPYSGFRFFETAIRESLIAVSSNLLDTIKQGRLQSPASRRAQGEAQEKVKVIVAQIRFLGKSGGDVGFGTWGSVQGLPGKW